jgi:hypothetical protein
LVSSCLLFCVLAQSALRPLRSGLSATLAGLIVFPVVRCFNKH